MSKWNNVALDFTIELSLDDGTWFDLSYDKELTAALQAEVTALAPKGVDSLELDFDVRSSGSYTAASMYGGRDHMGWEAEGEDERTVEDVRLLVNGKSVAKLSKLAVDSLEALYRDKIEAVDMPEQDYSEPDYD